MAPARPLDAERRTLSAPAPVSLGAKLVYSVLAVRSESSAESVNANSVTPAASDSP